MDALSLDGSFITSMAVKRFVFLLAFLLPPWLLLTQDINPLLYEETWLEQETRVINGYAVTKDFEQLPRNPASYNFRPITAVSYKDFQQLRSEMKQKAVLENLDKRSLHEALKRLADSAGGGQLQIYLSRYEENEANFRWYFVILRGEDNEGKLWEKEIGYQAPQNPYERGWWNYVTLDIPIRIKPPFYVYLDQKNSQFLSDFRFHVEEVEKEDASEK